MQKMWITSTLSIMLQQLPMRGELAGYLSVEGLEVLPEFSDAVALADLNAEALLVCHIGGQPA